MATSESENSNWAPSVDRLTVGNLPVEALNINVQGKRVMGPVHGFGQLWQKTYRLELQGARPTPQEVIAAWKAHFTEFWPRGNTLYKSGGEIQPGDVGVINSVAPGNVPMMSTGIYVIYADDVSFSFMTPEGHPWAGMVTFGAEAGDATTTAQVQVLVRANDPLYELGMRTFMSKMEDQMWFGTLNNVAKYFGATGSPTMNAVLVDRGLQWAEWKNIFQNSGMRTALYVISAPLRSIRVMLSRRQ